MPNIIYMGISWNIRPKSLLKCSATFLKFGFYEFKINLASKGLTLADQIITSLALAPTLAKNDWDSFIFTLVGNRTQPNFHALYMFLQKLKYKSKPQFWHYTAAFNRSDIFVTIITFCQKFFWWLNLVEWYSSVHDI